MKDVIDQEDLRVATMVQYHSLAKLISDARWSAFLALLTFTAVKVGKRVGAGNPALTSLRWSGSEGGMTGHKGRSVRWRLCPHCGTSLHRDHHAALNILRLGQEQSRPGYGRQAST